MLIQELLVLQEAKAEGEMAYAMRKLTQILPLHPEIDKLFPARSYSGGEGGVIDYGVRKKAADDKEGTLAKIDQLFKGWKKYEDVNDKGSVPHKRMNWTKGDERFSVYFTKGGRIAGAGYNKKYPEKK